uniref:Uncharacterized protein n=1 Tax=Megaselia scalaris TaxID=36166 RepID=T1GAU7_MEGSC
MERTRAIMGPQLSSHETSSNCKSMEQCRPKEQQLSESVQKHMKFEHMWQLERLGQQHQQQIH